MEKMAELLKIFNLDKKSIALLCFLTDLSLSIWSYLKLTNYDEYLKAVKPIVDSPDFRVQIYQVLLQSLTFSLILFLAFHLVIYILLYKEKKYAIKYVRVYTALAALSCFIMIFSNMPWAVLPLFIYGLAFVSIRKMLQPQSN